MVWESLSAGQKIALYGFILLTVLIYALLTKVRFFGRAVIPLAYRILIALFFPVVFALLFVFGAVLLGLIFALILVFVLLVFLSGKRIKIKRI